MFDGFFESIATVLAWFYSLIPNYGVAIGMLTVAVMAIITPLTLKSTRSMIKMQRLQPELKKLQEKYKGDREKLNTELMAFYKANDLNPLSGCIPMLPQIPIFIILYNVLRGLTVRNGGPGGAIGHVAGQLQAGQSFTPWKLHDQPFAPKYLDHSSEMYRALINTTKMKFLGLDLSLSPLDALRIGLLFAIPFLILMVLLFASQLIQNRQIQGRTRHSNQPVSNQQQMIMRITPFILPAFSISLPAGLGYYYLVQGLCRIGTQSYITRTLYAHGAGSTEVIDTSATEKSDKADKAPAGGAPAKKLGSGAKSPSRTPSSSGTRGGTNGAAKKAGSSAKSQAVQKKAATGGKSGGRRSGTPRAGGNRPSGT